MLAYFSRALKNEYIRLSKENDRKNKNEDYSENERAFDYDAMESNIEILDVIRRLNTYEKVIIKLIVFNGYKSSEIAKETGKSRQAINQVKNRAFKKLKKVYLI